MSFSPSTNLCPTTEPSAQHQSGKLGALVPLPSSALSVPSCDGFVEFTMSAEENVSLRRSGQKMEKFSLLLLRGAAPSQRESRGEMGP